MASAGPAGSWADSLTARIERAPVPGAAVYLTAWLILFAALTGLQWATGSLAVGTIRPLHALFAGLVVGGPWMVAIFNKRAVRAVRGVTPLLAGGAARAAELEEDIVRSPAYVPLVLGAAGSVGAMIRLANSPSVAQAYGFSAEPPALWLEIAMVPLLALSATAYGVKIAWLAWRIHRITATELRVDPWNVGPLFAFSGLTARMGISTVAGLTAAYLLGPGLFSDAAAYIGVASALGLASGVFVLPLLGLHGRLEVVKGEAQAANARRMERAVDELEMALAQRAFASMDSINKAIGSVEVAGRAIDRVPTWPWSAETFRWVVGALMLPVALLLGQYLLSRWLA